MSETKSEHDIWYGLPSLDHSGETIIDLKGKNVNTFMTSVAVRRNVHLLQRVHQTLVQLRKTYHKQR